MVREYGGIGAVTFMQELVVGNEVGSGDVGEGLDESRFLNGLHHIIFPRPGVVLDGFIFYGIAHKVDETIIEVVPVVEIAILFLFLFLFVLTGGEVSIKILDGHIFAEHLHRLNDVTVLL